MTEKFYAFLDTAKQTAKEARHAASSVGYLAKKEAGKAASAAQLNVQILTKQREIQTAYQELGKLMYDKHIGADTEPDGLMDKLEALDALHLEVAELEKKAGKVSVVKTCPTCGAEQRQGDAYCRECGEPLKKDAE